MGGVWLGLTLLGFGLTYWWTPYEVGVLLVKNTDLALAVSEQGATVASLSRQESLEGSGSLVPAWAQAYLEVEEEDDGDHGGIVGWQLEEASGGYGYELTMQGRRAGKLPGLINAKAEQLCGAWTRFRASQRNLQEQALSGQLEQLDGLVEEASRDLREIQSGLGIHAWEEAMSQNRQGLREADRELEQLQRTIEASGVEITNHLHEIVRHHPTILSLRRELNQALLRYTDQHPHVQKLTNSLALLEVRLREQTSSIDADIVSQDNSLALKLYDRVVELRNEVVVSKGKLELVQEARGALLARRERLEEHREKFAAAQARLDSRVGARNQVMKQRELVRVAAGAGVGGHALRLLEPAKGSDVRSGRKWAMAVVAGLVSGLLGGLLFVSVGRRQGLVRRRIMNASQLARAGGVPVTAELPPMGRMGREELDRWAFDALTALTGPGGMNAERGFVCGIISADAEEGRSTWVRLLSRAARRRGLRVLTIYAEGAGRMEGLWEREGEGKSGVEGDGGVDEAPLMSLVRRSEQGLAEDETLSVRNWDWAWHLQGREQWARALHHCAAMENTAVFIELPPLTDRRSVLLAESVPHLFWLCARGKVGWDQTQSGLEVLRRAGCRIEGALLNWQ